MIDFGAARLTMVDSQLRPNKVTDLAVLDAFLTVPRERFVPPALRAAAYVDDDIPIGDGRFLMQPMVLARLVQLAAIGPGDAVLEIGAGTGYRTAIAAPLARSGGGIQCEHKHAPRPGAAGRARRRQRRRHRGRSLAQPFPAG